MTDSDETLPPKLLKTDSLGRIRSTPEQRDAVLDAFEGSALSGTEFARIHGINYQTFATWRQKRKRRCQRQDASARPAPGHALTLVEVTQAEVAQGNSGVRIDLPGGAHLSVRNCHDAKLTAQLLAELRCLAEGGVPC